MKEEESNFAGDLLGRWALPVVVRVCNEWDVRMYVCGGCVC